MRSTSGTFTSLGIALRANPERGFQPALTLRIWARNSAVLALIFGLPLLVDAPPAFSTTSQELPDLPAVEKISQEELVVIQLQAGPIAETSLESHLPNGQTARVQTEYTPQDGNLSCPSRRFLAPPTSFRRLDGECDG